MLIFLNLNSRLTADESSFHIRLILVLAFDMVPLIRFLGLEAGMLVALHNNVKL